MSDSEKNTNAAQNALRGQRNMSATKRLSAEIARVEREANSDKIKELTSKLARARAAVEDAKKRVDEADSDESREYQERDYKGALATCAALEKEIEQCRQSAGA